MAGAGRSDALRGGARTVGDFVRSLPDAWRVLGPQQRAAAAGAVLLIVSTFGPFSFVEAGIVVLALGVLLLLKKRAEGREFHLPFGDGTVIAAAGIWAGLLIMVRVFDRPLGQGLLALVCAAILFLAGVTERAKRPADDLPTERLPRAPRRRLRREGGKRPGETPLPADPPEFLPARARSSEAEVGAEPDADEAEPRAKPDAEPDPGEPLTEPLPAFEQPPKRRRGGEDPGQDSLF